MTDPAALRSLIERVQPLTGPSREVDAEIAMAVMERETRPYGTIEDEHGERTYYHEGFRGLRGGWYSHAPEFTRSLDTALLLVPEGMIWDVTSTGSAWVMDMNAIPCGAQWSASHRPTPALALVLAALRAHLAIAEQEGE